MNKNNVYQTLYYYFVEGYSNMNKISGETGVHPKLINRIIKGERYQEVFNEFIADRKVSDFTRTYEPPKTKKIPQLEYIDIYNRYLQRLLSGSTTIRDIKGYLLEDDIEVKQADKLLTALETAYKEQIETLLEDKLFAILEVQRKPPKWTIDKGGNIVEIFPHPVLNRANRVTGIEYKKSRAIIIPDELFDTYCDLQDEIEKVEKTFEAKNNKKRKYTIPSTERGKAEDLMFLWLGQHQSGTPYKEIAEKSHYSSPTVSKYVKKAKEIVQK